MLPYKITEFNIFYNSLETRPPTANMMRWMQYFSHICSKSCCYSTDCACIRCSSCAISLTKLPPSLRYHHNHSKWLEITEKGIHSIVIREKGLSELRTLDKNEDFAISDNKDLKFCFICSEVFEKQNPPVKFPGCKKDHGSGMRNKIEGLIDSKEHAHRDCLLQWYEVSFREKYCGKPKYCEICNFEEEMESWKVDFLSVRKKINEMEESVSNFKEICDSLSIEIKESEINKDSIREKLLELHPQNWIQKIINEVFV